MADDTYSRGYRNDPYDRSGTGGSGSAPDPLTELARLIGQSDPFATDRNRQPDPRHAEHPQSGDWRDDPNQHAQHYDHGAHDDRYAGTGEPQHDAGQGYGSEQAYQNGYPYPQAGQHDARYDDAAGYGEQQYHEEPQAYHPDQHPYHQDQPAYPPSGQPQYAAEQGEYDEAQADTQDYPPPFFGDPNSRPDDYYDDEPAPRRGWLVTAAALVGLAVVGTAGALAYRAVFTGGETRIITRDVGPSKITPQASQDSANRGNERVAAAGAQNERLGPPPEQPITIPEPPRTVPSAIAPSPSAAVAPAAPIAPVLSAAPSAPAQATAPVDNNGARKVRTEKIKPDQLDTAATRPVGQSRNTAPSPVQPAQPRVVGPGPAPAPNAPLSLAPQGMSNPAPAPAPAPPMHTTAIAPPAQPAPHAERSSGGGSGYYVQVSAQKSEDEAKSSFRGIQARHASLLGGQQAVIRRKDLGSKGVFYGAQVGPFSREAAAKLCEGLKAAGQSCMVQRN